MSRKNITVFIDESEFNINIRRIKKKEFKTLVSKLAGKVDELIKFFDNKNMVEELPDFIVENIDFICDEVILPFTSLTAEQLDDMDVVDVVTLIQELLVHNHVNIEKIVNFLKPDPAANQKIAETINFGGISIPSLN